jgi:signal transduction histidine kinase
MALQAREITADTACARLTVPPARDELAHLGEAFNRVLDRLGRALDERQRFMADASHELRTPVSTIRTAVDVTLSRPDRDAAEYREALETVAQQGSRLARLVDDMLVLARADAGGYRLVVTDVDVGDVAADCVRELTPLARSRRVALTNDARRGTFLRGDETPLRRLLLNLLTNAILYTPPGGRSTITCEGRADVCELHVSDTGPGIPAEDQDRIFQRFIRLNPARGADGVGLGLAIARWIAESHGGTLRIAYSGATGTRFTASLPSLQPAADELNSQEGAA